MAEELCRRCRRSKNNKELRTRIGCGKPPPTLRRCLFPKSFLLTTFYRTNLSPPLLAPSGIGLEPGRRKALISGQAIGLRSVCNKLELLTSVGSVEFSGGKAEITEVPNCVGDAFLVTVRNKKRVGYNYELTLKVRGEWNIREEKKMVKGHIDIPEFSFGELDDLQMQVRISEEKDLSKEDKLQISQDLKMFLQPVREKLLLFEQELKDR
ncbi:uncharacterized protein LOC18055863 isoform X1 [Citrus clementina]|uniref:uncharacterized protein LOC18055863 isoform X1 n=1 Tax=Citrus clementina TaxID=85681 RepID=UPI0003D74BC9|nr:uncharacterized protein LOC18055863 isoform X1 [Citrus x clementina]